MAPRVRVGKDFRGLFLGHLFIHLHFDGFKQAHSPATMQLTVEGRETTKLSQPADTLDCRNLFRVSQMRGYLVLA